MGNIGDAAFSQGDVMRRLRELEGLVRELTAGRRLENATVGAGGLRIKGAGGIRLQAGGGLTVEDGGDIVIEGGDLVVIGEGVMRSENFDGNMTAGDPGSDGWALGNERLALRGQLVSPVSFDAKHSFNNGFAITTAITTQATVTFPVPAWADEALISVTVTGSGRNDTAAQDRFGVTSDIDGEINPGHWASALGNGFHAHNSVVQTRVVDVSAKTEVICLGRILADFATWSASVSNTCDLSATAIFRRAS